MNPFSKIYKNLSDKELFTVLEESYKYDPIAVEAASEEIKSRNISKEEKMIIEEQLSQKRQKVISKAQKAERVKDEFGNIVNAITPIQKEPSGLHTQIIVLAVLAILISISAHFNNYFSWKYFSSMNYFNWYVIEPLINMLVLPVAAVLFYKRKTAGWILMVFCFLRSLFTNAFYALYFFDSDFIVTSLTPVISGVLSAIVLWFLLKEEMKKVFKINKNTNNLVTAVSLLISFIIVMLTLNDI